MIPDDVIEFDDKKSSIGEGWSKLKQSIFSEDDQCLDIDDPLGIVLDAITADTEAPSGLVDYVINRLPIGVGEDGGIDTTRISKFLAGSFTAYRLQESGQDIDLENKIATITSRRLQLLNDPDQGVTWVDALASANGIPSKVIAAMNNALSTIKHENFSAIDWLDWILNWLLFEPNILKRYIRAEGVAKSIGNNKLYSSASDLTPESFKHIIPAIHAWFGGKNLSEIENVLPQSRTKVKQARRARNLSSLITLDLSYLLGLASQVWRDSPDISIDLPINLEMCSICIRQGLPSPEHYAISLCMTQSQDFVSRPQVCEEFQRIESSLPSRSANTEFRAIIKGVRNAMMLGEIDWTIW